MVVRKGDRQLDVRTAELWQASLAPMVRRTLAFDLAGRLPNGMMILIGAATPDGPVRSIDPAFKELAAGPDAKVILNPRWTLRQSCLADVTGFESRMRYDPTGHNSQHLWAGHERQRWTRMDSVARRPRTIANSSSFEINRYNLDVVGGSERPDTRRRRVERATVNDPAEQDRLSVKEIARSVAQRAAQQLTPRDGAPVLHPNKRVHGGRLPAERPPHARRHDTEIRVDEVPEPARAEREPSNGVRLPRFKPASAVEEVGAPVERSRRVRRGVREPVAHPSSFDVEDDVARAGVRLEFRGEQALTRAEPRRRGPRKHVAESSLTPREKRFQRIVDRPRVQVRRKLTGSREEPRLVIHEKRRCECAWRHRAEAARARLRGKKIERRDDAFAVHDVHVAVEHMLARAFERRRRVSRRERAQVIGDESFSGCSILADGHSEHVCELARARPTATQPHRSHRVTRDVEETFGDPNDRPVVVRLVRRELPFVGRRIRRARERVERHPRLKLLGAATIAELGLHEREPRHEVPRVLGREAFEQREDQVPASAVEAVPDRGAERVAVLARREEREQTLERRAALGSAARPQQINAAVERERAPAR
ncbi:MAG TPA: ABC-type transport auxiliary lipoprotein family protein, partial [Thermoanaerobaculia bacterium]|nr:ABC-type transport auxiliary lipoprotein family protein [Thermoanaerobaculia bacterium]